MTVRILGFGGSLRKGSYNSALLREASDHMPEDSRLEIFDISSIPIYNQDHENNPPQVVLNFKEAIKDADGLLIVTPEYNYSIPGFLKNAIDYASRPPETNYFRGKPVAFMSASTGMLGGSRAQYHLRQVAVFLDMKPINRPEVFINFAQTKFDQNMRLKDEQAIGFMRQLLKELVDQCRKSR